MCMCVCMYVCVHVCVCVCVCVCVQACMCVCAHTNTPFFEGLAAMFYPRTILLQGSCAVEFVQRREPHDFTDNPECFPIGSCHVYVLPPVRDNNATGNQTKFILGGGARCIVRTHNVCRPIQRRASPRVAVPRVDAGGGQRSDHAWPPAIGGIVPGRNSQKSWHWFIDYTRPIES